MANAIRALAIDAVKPPSGHPGMPMGMATPPQRSGAKYLKFDAGQPKWATATASCSRPATATMLLYALLHLTGHEA